MSRLGLALCFALLPISAEEKDSWLKITSPHFEIYTDAGERSGRDVARHFEQVHGFFLQRFKTGIDTSHKAKVILFRNEKEYEPYRPSQSAAAYFHPGEFHDFIVMNNSVSDWRPTAVHELTHLMVHQLGQELPLWLNEGLAELYSNMEPKGAQVMVGRDIPGRMQVLASDRWLPLGELLAVDHQSPIYNEKARAGIFYAECWKLVHMLHLGPGYDQHLTDFVRALLLNSDPAGAFRTAYGKDLPAVEADLRNYLTGNTISAMLFNIPLAKSIDTPEIESGASFWSRLAIAELLSNSRGRGDLAFGAYDSLAREFPNRWEVEEAMGLYAWHQRKMDEADQHFKRAEQLGCKNGPTFLLWGRVLGYSNRPREAVAALGKAVDLMPDSTDAKLAYGDALIRNGSWGAAVATLRDIKAVPAATMWRYSYNMAFGLYRLAQPDQARPFLANARKYAASEREKSSLDSLEAALDRPVRTAAPAQETVVAPRIEDQGAPRLIRRDDPPAERGPVKLAGVTAVEGVLENMECAKVARLHVRTAGGVKIFVIEDPQKIVVTSGTGAAVDLSCGPQKTPLKLKVEYAPSPDVNVTGLVRTLAFQ